MEPNSPKKIQFAVPLFQSQLDPQAAEHIRKRRPTPATLVIYNDPNSSELQLVVEQHFQRQEQKEAGFCDSPDTPSPITAQRYGNEAQWANHNCPEPNGNEAYVSAPLSSEESPGCSGVGGESPEASECQQNNLSSPSSVSR
ncbi:protein phosphatase 1 regulatory subunit 1C isoform X2 [Denticeps clupeoides]|uniref:protein phosphatase 1 regulatory subunit 1C isoform X2 n=1 Tax=Denticeps clupeoides TaxID=299321 RepID=UPI0010A34F12|nr:protein phosphatase 1 regulatory subunit 1C isoform X2 [Denticeps clupeoides]